MTCININIYNENIISIYYQDILKLGYLPLPFTSHKTFLKNKKRCGTSLPTTFLHDF